MFKWIKKTSIVESIVTFHYLEVVALNDEIPVLVPLHRGLRDGVHLALQLDVSLGVGGDVTRSADEARADAHLE